MAYATPQSAAKRLSELSFPHIFGEILLGQHERHWRDLGIYFERPHVFYENLTQHFCEMPHQDFLLPLYESNGDYLHG